MLYSEAPNLPTHTMKVAVIDATDFDGDFSFDLFCRLLRRRLHLLDPLRYKLVDIPLKLHHPMWHENCAIDWNYHVRQIQIPGPGGRRELDRVIGEVASTPLDRNRPLWKVYFVEGMADHRFALVTKVHHALADGVASANLMARVFDMDGPVQNVSDGYDACSTPSTTALLRAAGRDHIHHMKELPALVKDSMAGIYRLRRRARERGEHPDLARAFDPPPTFINHVVSPKRTFASATLSLAEVKQTSKQLDMTINGLVLAISAGALRELLLGYDGRANAPLVASVPVSIDTSADRVTGNALGFMVVSLPVHIGDVLERIRLVTVSARAAKENVELLGPSVPGRWLEYLPPPLATSVLRRMAQRNERNNMCNTVISNVPGPRERGRIGGALVSEIYSVGPLGPGSGVNITVWSYVDQLNISVLADDRTFIDVHEMTDAMVQAFVEIRRAVGLPAVLSRVATSMEPATALG